MRRLHDSRFVSRYFVGEGLDVGAGGDALGEHKELFPLIDRCRGWDLVDGDAQHLTTLPDNAFDFVHSSHCLEHMHDPYEALKNWLRVLKPGGHLVVMIPDEDMYEQGIFPSTFNSDHKWTFTICKARSWSNKSINLTHFLAKFAAEAQIIKIEQLDTTFRYSLPRYDQTLTAIGESALEFVMRKLTFADIHRQGRFPVSQ